MSDMREKLADIINTECHDSVHGGITGAHDAADAILAALPDMVPELEWQSDYAFLSGWPAKEINGEVAYSNIGAYVVCADFWNVNFGPDQSVKTLEEAKAAANTHRRQQVMKIFGLGDAT